MNNELQKYLLDLIIGNYTNPFDSQMLSADKISKVKVSKAVIGGVNTVAKITRTDGTVSEVSYNRELLSEVISSLDFVEVIGYSEGEEIDAEWLSQWFTSNGLSIAPNEIIVTKLGGRAIKIECSDESIRYYGSINVAISQNQT